MTRSLLAIAVVLVGCSTTILSPTHCTADSSGNAACRAAFGIGHVCGTDGLCTSATLPPRCTTVYPPTLFTQASTLQPVVYGVLSDRSEPMEVVAERATRLVAVLANQSGGLQTRTVGMVFCDVQSDPGPGNYQDNLARPDAVLAATHTLMEVVGVQGIIGPHASSDVESAFTMVVRAAPGLLISPSATSVALSALDPMPASDYSPGYLWRTVPPESDALAAMAQSIVSRNVATVFVVAPDGVGQANTASLQASLTSMGSTIALQSAYYAPASRPGMIDAIDSAASGTGQEIVFLGDTPADAITFLTLVAGDSRFASRTLMTNESAAVPDIISTSTASLFGRGSNGYTLRIVHYVTPNTTTFQDFRNQYRAEYMNQDPTPYPAGARAYDAAWLMLLGSVGALARSGGIDAVTIGLGLRSVIDPAGMVVNLEPSAWTSAESALMGGHTLSIVGASGPLAYNRQTEQLHGTPEMLVVDGMPGSWMLVPGQ